MNLLFLACTSGPAERVDAPLAPGAFPHELWGDVLAERVDAEGLIDFSGLAEDRAGFDAYLAWLATYGPDSHPEAFVGPDHVLAYHLNAYNAFATLGVLQRPGLASVADVKVRYFYLARFWMGGERINLWDLEHEVVRPLGDPRVHMALNCMSAGCPRLPREAFLPARLDAQLDTAAREFVAEEVRSLPDGRYELSAIFSWFEEDFEPEGLVAFVNAHGGDLPPDAELVFADYDWTLVAQPGRGP